MDDAPSDEIASNWIEAYNQHASNAMCDLVNFVLKCTGCDLKVDVTDIEDPDNATSRLSELQDEYQEQKITDYPLISRAKGNIFSRTAMINFFQSLIRTAHATGLLYNDELLMENIQVWVTTMSSSSNRPFRHTSTVISLAIATAVCMNIKEINDNASTTVRQKESEEKKKTVNKSRVAALKAKIAENNQKLEQAQSTVRDIFDTVFVHRYRDVDHKIRVDCVAALGNWIANCPDIFFESQYIRYLGFLLSDSAAATRGEVVKQLSKLYKHKDNLGRLRAFTEKFRPRMVEMATQDADVHIRSSVIELLDLIRELGLLEPDDIDTIGKLIFDSDPRVRKAIAGFFAENINDFLEGVMEDLGGEESLDEALGDEPEDEYDTPRKSWLKLKCLAEILESYDVGESEEGTPAPGAEVLIATGLESRYSMAAGVICDAMEDIRDWEVLAGYLLYDHSSTPAPKRRGADDPLEALKKRCQPTDKEERLLLEVLNAAVKSRLTEAAASDAQSKNKSAKARKDEAREIQEKTALNLANIIPRLLRKFGANPSTASAVLRLEPILDLEIFQELRQDSTEFSSLLDDINQQFLTHADRDVLANASTALLHARGNEDYEEATDSKIQELWEGVVGTLRQLIRAKTPQMTNLANTLHRLQSLASISDCTAIFEAEPRSTPKSKAGTPSRVFDILLYLIREYASVEDPDADSLIINAIKSAMFYYMWTVRALKEKGEAGQQIEEVPGFDNFVAALVEVTETRHKLDDTRLAAIETTLDVHALLCTLREVNSASAIVREVSLKAQQLILQSFTAAEKAFAKKAKKPLDGAADEDVPEEPESESEEEEDDENEGDEDEQIRRTHHRQQELLIAEKRLCDITGHIVLAIVAKVIDASGSDRGSLQKRIVRNRVKLGPNFKEVLAYLEGPKPKRPAKPKAKASENKANAAKSAEVVEEESEGEAIELEIPDDDEDEQDKEVEDAGAEEEERPQTAEEPEDEIMGD